VTASAYAPTATLATDPYAVEYYYRVRWGGLAEFLALFRKNHYPVLVRQLATGRVLEIRSEEPRFHTTDLSRWDLRVTLVYKDVVAAHDSAHEAALLKQMYPDQATFHQEERRRFELLLDHWDVPLRTLRLDQ
jgi:hypothetical protein